MGTSKNKKRKNNTSAWLIGVLMGAILSMSYGCAEDDRSRVVDKSIPQNVSWEINSVHSIDLGQRISPHLAFTHSDSRLYMTYYDDNPLFVEENVDAYPYRYRLRYVSFNLGDAAYLSDGNKVIETVALLKEEGNSIDMLDIALSGSTPMISYGVQKSPIDVEDTDLNNQGDVMIAVRDGANNWRNEIGAYGYVDPDRNPVFTDGLAKADFSLLGDDDGYVHLAFQFYYEGVDSYNYDYRDLNYIRQPVNGFINATVNDVADLEETVEGSSFTLPTGVQTTAGDACEMVIDADGNPVVFYYFSNLNSGAGNGVGLRMARRTVNEEDGEVTWEHEWLHQGVDIDQISAAVKSDGRLCLVYTLKDYEDFDYGLATQTAADMILPYVIRYIEQVDVVVGQDEETGEDIIERQWDDHEYVDFISISGRYCSMALDSEDNPVVAFFDEMNFTETRFFSRVKIAKRSATGVWDTYEEGITLEA